MSAFKARCFGGLALNWKSKLGCLTCASNPLLLREQLWVLSPLLIRDCCAGDGVCGDIGSQPLRLDEGLLLFEDEQVFPTSGPTCPVFFSTPLGTAFQGLIPEFILCPGSSS